MSYLPSQCEHPIDKASNPDLKKPLNYFAQLFIIYLRLSKTDIFIMMEFILAILRKNGIYFTKIDPRHCIFLQVFKPNLEERKGRGEKLGKLVNLF